MIYKIFEGTEEDFYQLMESKTLSTNGKFIVYADMENEEYSELNLSIDSKYPAFLEEGKVIFWDEDQEKYITIFPEELPEWHIEHPSNKRWLTSKIESANQVIKEGKNLQYANKIFEKIRQKAIQQK